MPDSINKFVVGDEDEFYKEEQSDVPVEPEKKPDDAPAPAEIPVEEPEVAQPLVEDQPVVHPYDAEYQRLGLDRQFPGGVVDALNRIPYMNKWQTQLSQEKARLEVEKERMAQQIAEIEAQKRNVPTTPDEKFWENPIPVLDQRYVTPDKLTEYEKKIQNLESRLELQRLNDFNREHPEMDKFIKDGTTARILEEEPGIMYLRDPLAEVYRRAKELTAPQTQAVVEKAKETINKNIEQQSLRATTSGTGRKPPVSPARKPLTQQELYSMPLEKLKEYYGGYGSEDE